MKITMVGNRTNLDSYGVSFNTEADLFATLIKLQHEVDFIQESLIEPGTLPKRVKGSDLFLWVRTWPGIVTDADLRAIEAQGIPTVAFTLDKYAGIDRGGDGNLGVKSVLFSCQHVFGPEGSLQSARIFKEDGVHYHYLPPGVLEDSCYIAEPLERFTHEIAFVGGGVDYGHVRDWSYRRDLVNWLQDTYGSRFGKYGFSQETVRGHALNQLCSSVKIMIGDSLCKDFMDSWYFSDRAWQLISRGSFMIAPYIAGITDYFVDRKEIVLYSFGNMVQLGNLISYYLEPANTEERQAIAKAGFERVKKHHTFRNRMEEMLSVLRAEGAIK